MKSTKQKVVLFSAMLIMAMVTVSFAQNFTIVALPDTQNYSQSYPTTFTAQTQWIVNNRTTLNIAAVVHEGDIVNTASDTTQWNNADAAMDLLDSNGIPYGVCPGNHDNPTTNYNTYFGVSRFSGHSYYGGHYGSTNDNNYILFSAGGMDFIAVFLQYGPTSDNFTWANGILAANNDRRAIVISHDILNIDGSFSTNGSALYNALKDNANLFLILCGHNHAEARRSDTYNGHTIHTLLADFQDEPAGGNGWLRILEFSTDNNDINVKTYSPTLDQWQTDGNSQFTINYDATVIPGGQTTIDFTAYNDLAWGTGQLNTNITRITSPTGGSGLPSSAALVNNTTGSATGVTLAIAGGSFSSSNATQGAEPVGGTDAYTYFNGKVSCMGVISYVDSVSANLVMTLSNMLPEKQYTIVFYGNRDSYTWDRASLVTISGADSFTNSSSAGLDNSSQPLFSGASDTSTRLPASNTATGYVAKFTNVKSGSDGTVALTISFDGITASEYMGKYASALMVQQLTEVVPTPNAWTSYNDLAWGTGQLETNITKITSPTGGSGLPSTGTLTDYASGDPTGATLTIAGGHLTPNDNELQGAEPAGGTDAYNHFNGKVSCLGVISYDNSASATIAMTLSNLLPEKQYTIVFYGNRDDYAWDRASLVTISGADSFTNSSSTGLDNNGQPLFSGTSDTSTRLPANNTATGYVTKFTSVRSGSDGTVALTISFDGVTGSQYMGKYASALMVQQLAEVPTTSPWVAYNDMQPGGTTAANATGHTYTTTNGILKNFATGANLTATLTGTVVGSSTIYTNGSNLTNSNSDAYIAFNGIIDCTNVTQLNAITDNHTMTFNGLNATKKYTITLTTNRDDATYTDRYTKITIMGADSYVNSSSTGVVVNGPNSVSFCTGYNTVNGYVAKWMDVVPGTDGSFAVKSEWDNRYAGVKGYGMSAVKLEEQGEIEPVPPGKAAIPNPAHGSSGADILADINWTAGTGTTSHDVYFGTSSPGTFRGNQAGTTFDPGTLLPNTTYYWRVDEKNSYGTTTGDVWSFTTVASLALPWSDGFESGNFTTGGWTTQDSDATVVTSAKYTGTYGARLAQTTWIQKIKSTEGYNTIHVKYRRATTGFDSGENIYVEWSTNGSTWNALETVQTAAFADGLQDKTCAAGADNNPNFRIRFRTNASTTTEYAYIDDIQITGTPLPPATVTVPNVVSMAQASAESAITTAGLVVGTIHTAYSPTVAAGNVISQTPTGGASVVTGTSVNIVVSLGQQMVTVPDVAGMTETNAVSTITAAGLTVSAIINQPSNTVPAGNVISQNPTGGTSVAIGSSVEIVVSLGPEMVTVPGVVGMTQADANTAIIAAGNLVIGTVIDQYSDTVAVGLVIRQDPNAGDSVMIGTAVNYILSMGPQPRTIRGRILDVGSQPLQGVKMNGLPGDPCTDAAGYYIADVNAHWSGTVTPTKYAYGFTPPSIDYNNVIADQNDKDYAGKLLTFAISGVIHNPGAVNVQGVMVVANNSGGADVTDANGYYELWVPYNWSGTVTPTKAEYTCTDANTPYLNIQTDQTSQDYTATSIYDLSPNGVIDFADLGVMTQGWLESGPGDFDNNEIVDFADFARFSEKWLNAM